MSPATPKDQRHRSATLKLKPTNQSAKNHPLLKKTLHKWPRDGTDETVIVLPTFDVALIDLVCRATPGAINRFDCSRKTKKCLFRDLFLVPFANHFTAYCFHALSLTNDVGTALEENRSCHNVDSPVWQRMRAIILLDAKEEPETIDRMFIIDLTVFAEWYRACSADGLYRACLIDGFSSFGLNV